MESVASFAPKTRDGDADIRYMAVSDLNTMLEDCVKGEKKLAVYIRNGSEQKTVFDCLLERVRLEDEGTVQEQVEKCFHLLCKCPDVDRDKCTDSIKQLLALIKKEKNEVDEAASNRREVASLSLREALKGMDEVPQSKGIAASFGPDLFELVQDTKAAADTRVKSCECFTVILQNNVEYVSKNPTIGDTLFKLLVSSTSSSLSLFRKRLVSCLVILSGQLSDEAFGGFVKTLCEKLSETASASEISFDIAYSLVQIVGSVGATANGFRIANCLNELLPLFVTLCKEPTNSSMSDDEEYEYSNNEALDELRSLIFQSCEVLLGKCASGLLPLVKPLLDLVSKFISYGSLVTGDEEQKNSGSAAGGAADGDEMEDDDGFDDDGFDDDFGGSDFGDDGFNDSTWKIRRDAIRCFVAIAAALVQYPVEFFESSKVIYSALCVRLGETDESVLLEALSSISSVFRSCSRVVTTFISVKTPSVVNSLGSLIPSSLEFGVKVAQKLSKIMAEPKTSVKVRTSCVQLAATLIQFNEDVAKNTKTQGPEFAQHFVAIWASVDNALKSAENSSSSTVSSGIPTDTAAAALKVESLHFLQSFLAASSLGISTRSNAVTSAESVAKCISDPYVHSASEALRVIPVIMNTLKREDGKVSSEDAKVVDDLAMAVAAKYSVLGTSSLEYEVKECAISALVSIVTVGGSVVSAATFTGKCLPIIMGSIQNESTRIIGIKALNEIASCATALDLSNAADSAIDLLRKMMGDRNNKQLRQTALAASAAVFKHEIGKKSISEAQAEAMMKEICPFISSEDLYLSHLVISVAANAIACCDSSKVKKIFADSFMEPVKAFIKAQPLQGATLSSFTLCFNVCGRTGVFSAPLTILEGFIKLVAVGEVTKQVIMSVATICAAYVKGVADSSVKRKCIDQLITLCKKPATPENQASQCFCMLTIGQIGRDCDLSDLLSVIMDEIAKSAFEKGTDDIRSAAASMLGSVAAGSISAYIKAIDAWSKTVSENLQYYVLATLREFASRLVESGNTAGSAQVCSAVADIVKALINKEDEGKRNIAAECLGKLCALTPSVLCPVVLSMVSDASKEYRTIAAGAIRVMYSSVIGGTGCAAWQCENKPLISHFIHDNASLLFGLIKDKEVQVRHVVLLTLNYILHQSSSSELIPTDVLSVVAPSVLAQTEIIQDLIEIVKYGPYSVKQDHGLEARKAAFECLSGLLDILPLKDVMTQLGKGLVDEYDIVLLTMQICVKLATSRIYGVAIAPFIDQCLKQPFDALVFPRSSGGKKPDEEERKEDLKKKVMRVLAAMRSIPGVSSSAPEFTRFLNTRIISAPTLSALLKEAEDSLSSSSK